ncbi:TMV resistance protein N-like [Bidens hawaiensis]|uniref:TMV resistance protein N-like n=1 Tax=Bidens hawaiensis TaxID=980011 RepID=UPI00404B54EF
MGGGGKTTLARAIFDHISIHFESKSFVENVLERSQGSGLKELQKQVLQDVLNDQKLDVKSVYDGKCMMKKMIHGRKVLLVLDDVDHIEHLAALAGTPNWFKPGSRIIITTRDEQVLKAHKVNNIHDVNLLSDQEALCLFSWHAFGREIPINGYKELSEKVVHYAAGLPLTIKVLGSHLCGRSELEWVDAINRLKNIPLKETLEKLELSYNGLENDQKEIFLDVVCMLKGETKYRAIRTLESCGFNARIGLRVLEQKSLITISNGDGLDIHDHIEEMGRNIVRRLHPNEPSKHSRLWIKEEIKDILVNELGTEAKRSIQLNFTYVDREIININGLRKMKELRLLYMDSRYLYLKNEEVSQCLPDALQSLCWHGYPFRSLPETFQANRLVNLDMRGGNISKLCVGGERKILNKLKFIDLSNSKLRTFDISMTPNLEMLNLRECRDFVELLMPVECLSLKVLDLSHSKVSSLNLGKTPHLRGLYLERCSYLQEINASVACLKNLVDFKLEHCLNFAYFRVDKEHDSAYLDSVATFEIDVKCVDLCPLHRKHSLPTFTFTCKYVELRPSWSGNFEKLISFGPCVCKNLEYILATICGLQHLRELTLEGSIPQDLWRLESLEMLSLWRQQFQLLPDSICMLKHLKSLKLYSCLALEQLPENICELEGLEVLRITGSESLLDIPNNICKMRSLKRLKITFCDNIKKLPDELGSLECLEVLDIEDLWSLTLRIKFFETLAHLSFTIKSLTFIKP